VRQYTLVYPKRPWTLNIERAGNKWKRAALVKEWRAAFASLAREQGIPRLEQIEVIASPILKNWAATPDTAACIGAAKAAIDGLCDAGVLSEDGPKVVRKLTFLAPEVTPQKVDALIIQIKELEYAGEGQD